MASLPEPANPSLRHRRGQALDRLGLLLAALTAVWTLVASIHRPDARPGPVLALVVGSVVLAAVSRRLATPQAMLVPGVVAIAVAGALVLGFPSVLRAGGAPTGYANSNAALAALGAVAATAAAAGSPTTRQRQTWVGLALLLAVAVGATGSLAASLALGLVALLALGSVVSGQVALAVVGGMVACSLALGVTVAIAAGGDPVGLGERSGLRAELWARAIEVIHDQPARGIGPGSYVRHLPTALDTDLRWAHHGYLQQAADQGLVGLVLLLTLVAWTYGRLWHGRSRGRARTLAGAAAVTIVALQASVDHVLHDAAVPLTLAVLVGWATADRPARGSQGSPHPRP